MVNFITKIPCFTIYNSLSSLAWSLSQYWQEHSHILYVGPVLDTFAVSYRGQATSDRAGCVTAHIEDRKTGKYSSVVPTFRLGLDFSFLNYDDSGSGKHSK